MVVIAFSLLKNKQTYEIIFIITKKVTGNEDLGSQVLGKGLFPILGAFL